jgi:hypothetical protein
MKIPKLKLKNVYEITWIDNNVPAISGWVDEDYLTDYINVTDGDKVKSTGYLYSQDKTFITLVGCQSLGKYKTWMRVVKIFNSCVLSITECKSKKIYEVK